MRWNSSSTLVMVSALAQVAARPTSTENTRADMTLMMGSMARVNSSSGVSRSPSAADWMERLGIMAKPAPMDMRAAHTEELYASTRARPSIREALLFRRVMEGAINPMIIKGTQKLIREPSNSLMVRMTCITVAFATRPTTMPTITPIKSQKGRLLVNFFIPTLLFPSFFRPKPGAYRSLRGTHFPALHCTYHTIFSSSSQVRNPLPRPGLL